MLQIANASSMVFRAACNEAIDASMRPLRQRVMGRLAQRCTADALLDKLLLDTWHQAEHDVLAQPQSPWNDKLVENKFVELIAGDPQWKTLVLEAVVQERRWSDIWNHGFDQFIDRCASLLEKLVSPEHPTARLTSGTLSSVVVLLLGIWIPERVRPGFYDEVLSPLTKPFKSQAFDCTPKVAGSAAVDLHVNAILDDKNLNASITPNIKPFGVDVALHPTVDTPVKFLPQIQYPPLDLGNSAFSSAKPQGLPVRLIPELDFLKLPGGLWDSKTGSLKVSVTELEAPTENGATTQTASSRESQNAGRPTRPLDKIEAHLDALSNDFQASKSEAASDPKPESKSDPKANAKSEAKSDPKPAAKTSLATLQQNQNALYGIAVNHGRAVTVAASPNSTRSVVLQWVGEDSTPYSCALTVKIGNIGADQLHVTVDVQEDSSNCPLAKQPLVDSPVGLGQTQPLSPWILSIDEMHRRWLFQHVATLRFTWQPGLRRVAKGPGDSKTRFPVAVISAECVKIILA